MVDLLDIFAGVAYLLTDILATVSVISGSILLLVAILSWLVRRRLYPPAQILGWAYSCLLFGAVGLVILIVDGEYDLDQIGLFRISVSSIAVMLVIAQALLIAAKAIPTPRVTRQQPRWPCRN